MTAHANPDHLLITRDTRHTCLPVTTTPDAALRTLGLWRVGPWQPITADSAWTLSARVEEL